MREERLIREGSSCDTDFMDKTLQTVADAKKKEAVYCSNLAQCQKRNKAENIQCYRRIANRMAGFILDRLSHGASFEQAVREEKENFFSTTPYRKLWVFRKGKWQVVKGKGNVINEIVAFARLIIDLKPNERPSLKKESNTKDNSVSLSKKEEILKDVREHPENHRHEFNDLVACCTIGGCVDNSLIEAHSKYVRLGINAGIRCDVSSGHCACGAWH